MRQRFQRLIALTAVLAVLVPPSASAEKRTQSRTAAQLEAEMARVFGARRSTQKRTAQATMLPSRGEVASILEAMNDERATRGLGPLRLNQQLSRAAQDRVEDMFAKNYFAHVSPDGVEPFVWVTRHGYRYRIIGENLAVGFRGMSVVDGWMRSPGHRENILQSAFDEVGIAIAEGSPRRGYRGPLVVAMYGAR